jgi:hypothetical protein
MPNSIPTAITLQISEQAKQLVGEYESLTPEVITQLLIRIGQFGYSLGSSEQTRNELKPESPQV